MGGWHIAHRATKISGIIGAVSTITLPKYCGEIPDSVPGVKFDGVFPEFIHGFYANSYGIDIGIVYRKGGFEIFYHALPGTCSSPDPTTSNPPVSLNVSKGDTVQLKTYINRGGKTIVAEVYKGSRKLGSYETDFTPEAAKRYVKGAVINREIVMAANRQKYIPSTAYFSDVTMSETVLTLADYSKVNLTAKNSTLKTFTDEGSMDSKRYGVVPKSTPSGCISDMGSCDFR
ncbi:MAG: hypothetical protein AB9836_09585 [Aminipila sp.]